MSTTLRIARASVTAFGALALLTALVLVFALQTSESVPEDHRNFNCHTMGNRVCGPDAPADGFVNRP